MGRLMAAELGLFESVGPIFEYCPWVESVERNAFCADRQKLPVGAGFTALRKLFKNAYVIK